MLKIKNISKIYYTGEVELRALNNVSINFRKNEFVSILGASGSGKSTLLNIIGGLDNYNYGDLIIDGTSTRFYGEKDWDAYRNNRIGFVFQNYNLIMHQTVLSNVELALTLSGVSKKEREERALKALKDVGLEAHVTKKPTQLSGGQMQRVAIARAIVNNPQIILADEPTGALDSETSIQIMDILKSLSKDRLVIMVTHNSEIAEKYSTRIINLKDGQIISDTKEYKDKEIEKDEKTNTETNKTNSMGFLTALSLSFNNLMTKKGRAILTSIAGAIGITGICLVLGLTNGVKKYSDEMQREYSSTTPISISNVAEVITNQTTDPEDLLRKEKKSTTSVIFTDDISNSLFMYTKIRTKNINTEKLKTYLEENKNKYKNYVTDIQYKYDINLQFYTKINGNIEKLTIEQSEEDALLNPSILQNGFKEINTSKEIIDAQYELITGKLPETYNEIVLVLDENQSLPVTMIYSLGLKEKEELYKMLDSFDKKSVENIEYKYTDFLDKEYKVILNADFYSKNGDSWINMSNNSSYINKLYDKAIELKVVGIVKVKENSNSSITESGFIGYSDELTKKVIEENSKKEIVKQQLNNKKVNVLTGTKFDEITSLYSNTAKELGIADINKPSSIEIYGETLKDKEKIKELLDDYNKLQTEADKVEYVDMMESVVSIIKTVVNIISIVLIAFVSISLIVACIMISIITYISVLERTKEIGVLRAIGASKKDIKRVFNAETIVEGFAAGVIGVATAILISIAANSIISFFADINNLISIPLIESIVLILISITLTFISGFIPAKMASNKNPIEALKTE